MKMLISHLHLSPNLRGRTRQRCPNLVFSQGGEQIAALRSDIERPLLPLANGEIDVLEVHDDALSRVIDEAAWLEEMARVIAPNGEIQLTLPASGALAWLDTMNMYRYAVDIGKRGDQPNASLPTGWNRHYSREDVSMLLHNAGFDRVDLQSANYADKEIGLFARMMWSNWIRGERDTETRHFRHFGSRIPGSRIAPFGTTWSITARKRD